MSTPNANTSARASARSPFNCSGDIYAGVPMTDPEASREPSVPARTNRGVRGRSRELDRAVPGPHDVLRLEIAVDDTTAMGVSERVRELHGGANQRVRLGRWSARDLLAKRVPVHEFGGDEQLAVNLLECVGRADSGVRQGGRGAGLSMEPFTPEGSPTRCGASALSATCLPSRVSVARYTRPMPPRPTSRMTL